MRERKSIDCFDSSKSKPNFAKRVFTSNSSNSGFSQSQLSILSPQYGLQSQSIRSEISINTKERNSAEGRTGLMKQILLSRSNRPPPKFLERQGQTTHVTKNIAKKDLAVPPYRFPTSSPRSSSRLFFTLYFHTPGQPMVRLTTHTAMEGRSAYSCCEPEMKH